MAHTYEKGAWGSWDDAPDDFDFDNMRKRYQFQYIKDIDYILGTCAVYVRSNKTRVPCNYAFLCTLSVKADTFYPVWISDLPNLLQFFREIGTSSTAESLSVVLSDLSQSLVNLLNNMLESAEDEEDY